MVSRKMKDRKRAVAEKKCHMSWLSKKSITLQSSFLSLKENIYIVSGFCHGLHNYLDSGGVLFLDWCLLV